jgi:hypothetical protein
LVQNAADHAPPLPQAGSDRCLRLPSAAVVWVFVVACSDESYIADLAATWGANPAQLYRETGRAV